MSERVLLVAMSLMLASCFTTPLSPHKIDIQQGNYVDQEAVAKLRPGMTRSQVRFVLGTPLVADPFHSNRWDYVYRMQKNGGPPEERKITVVFEDDKLLRVDGDIVPGDVAEDAKPKVAKTLLKTSAGAAGPAKKESPDEKSLKQQIESLIAEKEAQGKSDAELRKSLVKLLGVEERDTSTLPRAKPVTGREKAPPEPKQAQSDLPKTKTTKVAKAKSERKTEEAANRLRASGLSAQVLSALGVNYQGDGKPEEEVTEVTEAEEKAVPEEKATRTKKTAAKPKSGLKADGLSADILRTLGVPFEGEGAESAAEEDEETVAEGEAQEKKEEKAGVLDELKNAEGKSVKEQFAEKFGIGGKDKKEAIQAEEESSEEEVTGKPTFMDDVRTVLGLAPAKKTSSSRSEKISKKDVEEDVEEEVIEEEVVEEEDEATPRKPTFWEDMKTVLGID